MQEQVPLPRDQQPLSDDLADRLDALSRSDAERVLERAIELHDERRQGGATFDVASLHRIADELGIDREAVNRAIREQLIESAPTPGHRRILGPRRIVGREVARGSAEEVTERVSQWLTKDEGLRPSGRTGGGVRWVPDKHWTTAARTAISGRGTKALKGLKQVTHRQIQVGPDEHVVELEADTERIGLTGVGVGAGVFAGSLVGGVFAATGIEGGNDVVQFLYSAGPGFLIGIGTGIAIIQGWSRTIRSGIQRALDGITEPDLEKELGVSSGNRIRDLVGEVADAIDERLRNKR